MRQKALPPRNWGVKEYTAGLVDTKRLNLLPSANPMLDSLIALYGQMASYMLPAYGDFTCRQFWPISDGWCFLVVTSDGEMIVTVENENDGRYRTTARRV
jgi:hypothetical protein